MKLLILVVISTFAAHSYQSISGHVESVEWKQLNKEVETFQIDPNQIISTDNIQFELSNDVNGIDVEGLIAQNNNLIEYLPVEVYNKFPNLLIYQVFNCSLKTVQYENFKKLEKLEFLLIKHNPMLYLGIHAFKDLKNLKYLNLSNNKFKRVGDNYFGQLEKLIELDLSNNMIFKVGPNTFDGLVELKYISLSKNEINTLNDLHFTNNKKLEKILLNDNQIMNLESRMFDNMKQLKIVDLKGNNCIDGVYDNENFQQMKENIEFDC